MHLVDRYRTYKKNLPYRVPTVHTLSPTDVGNMADTKQTLNRTMWRMDHICRDGVTRDAALAEARANGEARAH